MNEEGFLLGFGKNPAFALVFGLCPVLAVTTSLYAALAVGACVLFLGIALSALVASFDQYLSPKTAPFIWLIVAAFLSTLCGIFVGAIDPFLEKDLGIYIPLLAVNCMIQGQIASSRRSISFGETLSRNLGMALAFTVVLAVIALSREALGNGTISLLANGEKEIIVNLPFLEKNPIRFFVCAGGAFLVFGYALAAFRLVNTARKRRTP